MAQEDKTKELAKERAREKAKKRLEQLNSGDLTRGLGGNAKSKTTVSEVIASTRQMATMSNPVTSDKTTNSTGQTKKSSFAKSTDKADAEIRAKNQKLEKELVNAGAVDVIATNASRGRERRNKLIISILAVSIVLVWGFVLILRLTTPSKPDHNVHVYMSGVRSNECTLLLNGKEHTEWHIRDGLSVGKIYSDNVSLKVDIEGVSIVKFRLEIFKGKTLLENYGLITTGEGFVYAPENGKEWYTITLMDAQEIVLFKEIAFYYSSPEMSGLNSNNISIDIYVEVI